MESSLNLEQAAVGQFRPGSAAQSGREQVGAVGPSKAWRGSPSFVCLVREGSRAVAGEAWLFPGL